MSNYKISDDAAQLLDFFVGLKKKLQGKGFHISVKPENIKEAFGWEDARISNAVDYLNKKSLIEVSFYLGGNFGVFNVMPYGIDLIESPELFKSTFNVEYNAVKVDIEKVFEINPQLKASLLGIG